MIRIHFIGSDVKNKVQRNRGYSLIKKGIKKLVPYQMGTFVFSLMTIIVSVIIINLLQTLVDMLQLNNIDSSVYTKLIISCIIYTVFMITFQIIFKRTQMIGANEVTILLYNKIQEKPLHFYKNHKSGELVSLINNEGKAVGDWLSSGLLILLNEFTVLILNLAMMLYYNVTLSLILAGLMAIFFVSTKVLASKMAELSADSLKVTGKINSFILETLKSETLIHTLNKNRWFQKRFLHIIKNEKYPIDYKRADVTAFYMTIFALLSVLLPIFSVVIGAYMAQKYNLTGGVLLAFYAHTMQIQEPVRYIPEFLSQRKNTIALSEHLLPIVEETNEVQEVSGRLPNKIDQLSIDIEYFTYQDGNRKLLSGINFELNSKDIILVKGNSGVGKSTLVDLLMGFITSDKAIIKQNNIDCINVSTRERWDHMLLVGQSPLLIEGSLQDNILMGEEVSKELLDEIIYTACLDDFIKETGMDRSIGGENDGVSGGQKQRISIARMLIRKPDILILDEPTSALDMEVSLLLAERLTRFTKENNMILIIISHKGDFDKYVSKILEIKEE